MAYVKTQKAKGYVELCASAFVSPFGLVSPEKHQPTVLPELNCARIGEMIFPRFARPCPMRPRHGFVESRKVHSIKEALHVFRETIAADNNGELILAPAMSARFSGVATNAGVSFGVGNDGVTAAKAGSVFVPCPVDVDTWNHRTGANRVGVEQCAFVELVENAGDIAAVQLRDGPAMPTTLDFVPRDETVTRVFTVQSDDLLQWESDVVRFVRENDNKPNGLVFDHAGGALSSHFAVHAIQAGIAVITSGKSVMAGDTLRQSSDVKLEKHDLQAIAENMKGYLNAGRKKDSADIASAVATIHASATWSGANHLNRLVGFAPSTLFRYVAAACIGEARHYPNQGSRYRESAMDWSRFDVECGNNGAPRERDDVYSAAFQADSMDVLRGLLESRRDFSHEWRAANYGGENWRNIADHCAKLYVLIARFCHHPTKTALRAVMQKSNLLLNATHNNGRVLNKYMDSSDLTKINQTPQYGFCNPAMADILGVA